MINETNSIYFAAPVANKCTLGHIVLQLLTYQWNLQKHIQGHFDKDEKSSENIMNADFHIWSIRPIISSVPDTSAPHFGIHRPKM